MFHQKYIKELKTKTLKKNNVSVITLGCSKNLVDSENLMTQLKGNHFNVRHDFSDDETNIVVVNTCGFIDLAKEESIQTILEYANLKTKGEIEKLYVTGCLSQRYKDNLEEEIPEVDAFFGTMEIQGLLNSLDADFKTELVGERFLSTPSHFAYLKIAEGCNRTCSFCAIPLMRGHHVSKTIDELVKEATYLAKIGVKELILISQELTYYGLDVYKKRQLPELLFALSNIDGIEWIRLQYAYPSKFPLEIIEAMNQLDKVCNYLDMPLQHASNSVLKNMKRQITLEETKALINDIRKLNPSIGLRTTFLVGFPGETDDDFNELCHFVKEMKFERLGVFKYSHEEGTSAYELEDDIPTEIKDKRANILMDIQREISEELNLKKIGQVYKVLIDRKEGGYYIGRTEYDSYEVDNEVLIDAKKAKCKIGQFYSTLIEDATEYDLFASII